MLPIIPALTKGKLFFLGEFRGAGSKEILHVHLLLGFIVVQTWSIKLPYEPVSFQNVIKHFSPR